MATVRTTLVLTQQRMRMLKRIAAEQGRTLSSVVDEVLQIGLERVAAAPARPGKMPKLPVFSMGEARVDIADRNQLYDLFDSDPG